MEKISVEKAAGILHSKGMEISVEEAKLILEMLRKFASILVADCIENQKEIKHKAAVA